MDQYTRDRGILPVALPVGVILFIALVTVAMSQILLNVPKEVATGVALATSMNVLIAFSLFAWRPSMRMPALGLMGAVAIVPLVIGGAVAAGLVDVAGGEGEHAEEPEEAVVAIAAKGLVFDKKTLNIPAGQSFRLRFNNQDKDPHNVEILRAKGGEKLFTQPFFGGPKTVTWEVSAIPAGEYYFHCQVHPDMNGTVTAEASGEPHGEEEAETVRIAAKGLRFDKSELEVPADRPFKLEFDNRDQDLHNVEIFSAKGGTKLFTEKFFPGPKKALWDVPALKAGEYYFHCQVHPDMNGTVKAA